MNEKDGLAAIARRRPLVDPKRTPWSNTFSMLCPHFAALFPHRRHVFACTELEVSPDKVANLAKLHYHVSKFVRIEPRLQ